MAFRNRPEGQKLIQQSEKPEPGKTKQKLEPPTLDDFREFCPKMDAVTWRIIEISLQSQVKSEQKNIFLEKFKNAKENLKKHQYLYYQYKSINYTYFSSVFEYRLKNSINSSVIFDSQYLSCLYQVDYFVSNDRYMSEAAKFIFHGEKIGKAILPNDFLKLINDL